MVGRALLLATLLAVRAAAPKSDASVSDGSYAGGAAEIRRRAEAALDRRQRAKNVLLLIADGNGVATNFATRLWQGQQAGGYGDEYVLAHERMPALALSKTYNTNAQTPDSAGTATALNAGLKTKSGVLGLNEQARYGFCEDVTGNKAASLAEHAKRLGRKVGVVSTARLTHATPGAVYAHSADREWEAAVPPGCTAQDDIALQLFDAMVRDDGSTPLVDVALGGGRRSFFPQEQVGPEGDAGARTDGVDLIELFQAEGGAYAFDTPSFGALPLDGAAPLLGLFDSSHMAYEHDRVAQNLSEPSLAAMTAAAVRALEARDEDDNGWFLMVEGGRVDHANHAGNIFRTVTEGAAYQEAVEWALQHLDPAETLVVSTSDHGHALGFNGYCGRGSPVTGLCYRQDDEGERHLDEPLLGDDNSTFTVASFLNGEGSVLTPNGSNALEPAPHGGWARPPLSAEEAEQPDYQQQALVPLPSETHSATDVAVYALGPSSQLLFGTIEQSWIFHVMLHAMETEDDAALSAHAEPVTGGGQPLAPAWLDAVPLALGCAAVGAVAGGLVGHRVGLQRGAGPLEPGWERARLV